jgi:hypothetical protein
VNDLVEWVRQLSGCPTITDAKVAACTHPAHTDDATPWFYVEADPNEGVARLRCIADGQVQELLDSGERWTYPKAWLCPACSQSIAEVVYGIHTTDGIARWLVVTVRCVECGEIGGVTDVVVNDVPIDALVDQL